MNMDMFYKLGRLQIEDLTSKLEDVLTVYIENYNASLLSITPEQKWKLMNWKGVFDKDGKEIPYEQETAFTMLENSPELRKAYDDASDQILRSVHNESINKMIMNFEHYTEEFIEEMKQNRDLALKKALEKPTKSDTIH